MWDVGCGCALVPGWLLAITIRNQKSAIASAAAVAAGATAGGIAVAVGSFAGAAAMRSRFFCFSTHFASRGRWVSKTREMPI